MFNIHPVVLPYPRTQQSFKKFLSMALGQRCTDQWSNACGYMMEKVLHVIKDLQFDKSSSDFCVKDMLGEDDNLSKIPMEDVIDKDTKNSIKLFPLGVLRTFADMEMEAFSKSTAFYNSLRNFLQGQKDTMVSQIAYDYQADSEEEYSCNFYYSIPLKNSPWEEYTHMVVEFSFHWNEIVQYDLPDFMDQELYMVQVSIQLCTNEDEMKKNFFHNEAKNYVDRHELKREKRRQNKKKRELEEGEVPSSSSSEESSDEDVEEEEIKEEEDNNEGEERKEENTKRAKIL